LAIAIAEGNAHSLLDGWHNAAVMTQLQRLPKAMLNRCLKTSNGND
jgi:hypothetical protein